MFCYRIPMFELVKCLVVRSVAHTKGQDSYIAYQLEKLLTETNMVKIIQHDIRHCNMSRIIEYT